MNACAEHGDAMLAMLVAQANNPKLDPRVRQSAMMYVVDRGYGKPSQAITGPGGEALPPVSIVINGREAALAELDATD